MDLGLVMVNVVSPGLGHRLPRLVRLTGTASLQTGSLRGWTDAGCALGLDLGVVVSWETWVSAPHPHLPEAPVL